MHNHWVSGLCVRDILLEHKPGVVLELGAASGENTVNLCKLKTEHPHAIGTILVASDGHADTTFLTPAQQMMLQWVTMPSWAAIELMQPDSVDCAIVDTDHNYWTLQQELAGLNRVVRRGGLILIHDTETYRQATGKMPGWFAIDPSSFPYPRDKIEACEKAGLMYGDALREFLLANPERWEVLRESVISNGATAITRIN